MPPSRSYHEACRPTSAALGPDTTKRSDGALGKVPRYWLHQVTATYPGFFHRAWEANETGLQSCAPNDVNLALTMIQPKPIGIYRQGHGTFQSSLSGW